MQWREYVLARSGFFKQREYQFEHTRAICYFIAGTNRDPKKPFPTMEEFWKLGTDPKKSPNKREHYYKDLIEKAKEMYKDRPLNG